MDKWPGILPYSEEVQFPRPTNVPKRLSSRYTKHLTSSSVSQVAILWPILILDFWKQSLVDTDFKKKVKCSLAEMLVLK